MMAVGIVSGLLAAGFQGSAYFFSRHFLIRHGSPFQLLVASQLILGAASLLILPFTTPAAAFDARLIGPLMICSLCFMGGQVCFFQALRRIESSRIASIIGLKVVLVPVFMYFVFGSVFNVGQLSALLLALAAVLLMNYHGGGKFNWNGMGYCSLALVGYSWSDIGVKMLVEGIGMPNIVHSALIGANFNNIFVALLLLPFSRSLTRSMFRDAWPFAFCWGAGVISFFSCFGYVGPAFGNVVQAMRGPFSLAIGIILAHLGYRHLEEKVSAPVWGRRALAALLMVVAIVIYAVSIQKN